MSEDLDSGSVGPKAVCWAIVVAAGAGLRLGASIPKQFLTVAGRRVIDWSVTTAAEACRGNVVVVVPPDDVDKERASFGDSVRVVGGGDTRSASVRAGLAVVPDDCVVVVIHDAARPLVPLVVFERVVAAVLAGASAAIPGLPVVDTVKLVRAHPTFGSIVVETPPRDSLMAVQTPQAFSARALRRAHEAGAEATDDASLIEALGLDVVVVAGDVLAKKLTNPEDVPWFELHAGRRGGS